MEDENEMKDDAPASEPVEAKSDDATSVVSDDAVAPDSAMTRMEQLEAKVEHLFKSLGHILPPMKE